MRSRYELQKKLGDGGFATTWLARDTFNDETVALKQLRLERVDHWKTLELFQREAQTLQHLSHPNIPRYLNHFEDASDGHTDFYLVQSFVHGQDLRALILAGGFVNIPELTSQLLGVLEYLHAQTPPIIHRDIKPANIMCAPDGQFYLIDFGAVKQVVTGRGRDSTVAGTFGYMAPEQLRGIASPESDLYGLGTTLLFAMTRTEPEKLPGDGLRIDLSAIPEIPDWMRPWLKKILEPSPKKRFSSAREASAAFLSAQPQETVLDKNISTSTEHLKTPPAPLTKDPPLAKTPESDIITRIDLSNEQLEARKAGAKQWEGGVALSLVGLGLGWPLADTWFSVFCFLATIIGIFMTVPSKDKEAEGDLRWQLFYTKRWFWRTLLGFGVATIHQAIIASTDSNFAYIVASVSLCILGIINLVALGQWRTLKRHLHFEQIAQTRLPVLREGATYDVFVQPVEYAPHSMLKLRSVVKDESVGWRLGLSFVLYWWAANVLFEDSTWTQWDTGRWIFLGLCTTSLLYSFIKSFQSRRRRFSINSNGVVYSNCAQPGRLSYEVANVLVLDEPPKHNQKGRDVVLVGIIPPALEKKEDLRVELWRIHETHPVIAASLRDTLDASIQSVFPGRKSIPHTQL